jgi:hypothetical protein
LSSIICIIRYYIEYLLTFDTTNKHIRNHPVFSTQAPFWLIGLTSREDVYTCYEAFIAKMLPNTFTDNEFGGLQCVFTLFRLLTLYHDPQLGRFLDQHDMGPELYASSWFITLYANRVDPGNYN